jgi:FtsZ-interacting cell division protein ZipA
VIGMVVVVGAGIVLVGLLVASFFVRRHRESTSPQAGWRKTDEVFNDPSTDRVMRVWVDRSGERHYVVEEDRPAT